MIAFNVCSKCYDDDKTRPAEERYERDLSEQVWKKHLEI